MSDKILLSVPTRKQIIRLLLYEAFRLASASGFDIYKADSEYGKFLVKSEMFEVIVNEGLEPNPEEMQKVLESIKRIIQ